MIQNQIFTGTVPNDGTGTTLEQGGDWINANFNEIYPGLAIKAASDTLGQTDEHWRLNGAAGAVDATLPAITATNDSKIYTVSVKDITNTCRILVTGADVFSDLATSYTFVNVNDVIIVQADFASKQWVFRKYQDVRIQSNTSLNTYIDTEKVGEEGNIFANLNTGNTFNIKAGSASGVSAVKIINNVDVTNLIIKDDGNLFFDVSDKVFFKKDITNRNLVIGTNLAYPAFTRTDNTIVGINSAGAITSGRFNSVYGSAAFIIATTGEENSIFGSNAANQYNGSYSVMVGSSCGFSASGNNNTLVGRRAGNSCTGSTTAMGHYAGYQATTRGIFLGHWAGYRNLTDNKLLIHAHTTGAADAAEELKMSIISGDMTSANENQTLKFAARTKITQYQTLTGNITNSNLGSLELDSEYIVEDLGSHTVTRHNYVKYINPTKTETSGTITITDAFVAEYDAAAGVHLALDAGTTKSTPGSVDAWEKVNINGTIYYRPLYTSKTT